RILSQILGEAHVAHHPREPRDQPRRLDPPDGVDRAPWIRRRHALRFSSSFPSFRARSIAGLSPKSSSSKNGRTSITGSSLPNSGDGSIGARLAHSTASSIDFTSMIQYPPISSFDSAKGPSMTLVRRPFENWTRTPSELGL